MASAACARVDFKVGSKFIYFLLILCALAEEHEKQESAEKEKSALKDLKLQDVVFVVISQPNQYHAQRSEVFKQHFDSQLNALSQDERPALYLTHKEWPEKEGMWTVIPLIKESAVKFSNKRWIFVCEEETRIDLHQLLSVLQHYDDTEKLFLGRALQDKEATIIHHFAFFDNPSSFAYPDFSAGVAFSLPLVRSLQVSLTKDSFQSYFSIDAKHELAMLMKDTLNVSLTPLCQFCGWEEREEKHLQECGCVTWLSQRFPVCGKPIDKDELFVAVKTCSKFHDDRVSIVKSTWGRETNLIEYYSDVENSSIPTIYLGVPNTEKGHCGKTQRILQRAASIKTISSRPWVLIADDDTIISLELLRNLLACYKDTEGPLFLGERYGYGVTIGSGYNYITGGGGMVFNQEAVQMLAKEFSCSSIDSPDDMLLGMYFRMKDIPITHSPYFHQARPEDYSEDFLKNQIPVSFHKHWNNDPYNTYYRLQAGILQHQNLHKHIEL